MDSDQPQFFNITLSRPDSGVSWGFRLQGGQDFNTPLSIQVVQPRSVAERCGLRAGDGILQINNANTDGMSHEQAKMEIIRSSNDINFVVQRGAVSIWKPKVTPMSELRPQELQPIQSALGEEIHTQQRTSLAKDRVDETSTIGSGYNRTARPFGPQGGGQPKQAVPNVVHAQFNSPIGLYSAGNIAKTYTDQTAGIQRQLSEVEVDDKPVGLKMTGTYQVLDNEGQENECGVQYDPTSPTSPSSSSYPPPGDDLPPPPPSPPPSGHIENDQGSQSPESLQPPPDVPAAPKWAPVGAPKLHDAPKDPTATTPNPSAGAPSGFRSVSAPVAKPPGQSSQPRQDSMHCNGCGNMVTGVFVRVKGLPYHEKCFKCTNCGVFLKQKGYFMIEGQLYCEVHARRAAQAPGDNMRSAGVVYR